MSSPHAAPPGSALDTPSPPAPTADDAGLGDLADQYELLAEVGRGGSAVVYRARDRRLGREVALKAVRLAPALSPRERAAEVARLAREARTTARLSHPNIVTVYAVHELRDGLAVAMQYIPGRSLKQLLADAGPMDPAPAVRLLGEVAAALAYAHAHGVVHRDVKPENIFVDAASGRAMLADFGAARAGDADVRVTRTGATVGTPAYMAPEQIDGGAIDGRADLYSLGLVAWETLTGRRPWEGAGLYQLLHHQKHDVLPPVAAVRPADRAPVPLTLEYVVARLLEKRPAARWASAEVVGAQLEHPVLPADYKLWAREYRRRLQAAQAAGPPTDAGRPSVSAAARTEQFRPGDHDPPAGAAVETAAEADAPALIGAGASAADDAPSWARPRAPDRRRWVAGGIAAALVAATVPLLARSREAPPAVPTVTSSAPGAIDLPPVGGTAPGPSGRAATSGPTADAPAAASPTPDGGLAVGPAGLATTPGDTSAPGRGPAAATAATAAAVVAHGAGRPTVGDTGRRVVVAVMPPASAPPLTPRAGTRTAGAVSTSPGRSTPVPPAPSAALPAARSPATTSASAPAPVVVSGPATAASTAPASRPVIARESAIIAAGGRHSCALDGAGYARCWGANDNGQLGAGDLTPRDTPAPVSGDLRFAQVSTGGAHTCALTADGDAYCWGDDDHGQLGDATGNPQNAPVRVAGAARFRTVRAGLDHNCAVTTASTVACWGANRLGQLGDGSTRDRATPTPVPGIRAAAIAVGWRHTCALTPDGGAVCWGDNSSGQLGDGSRATRPTPTRVAGSERFVAIAAGATHTCAASTDGATYCWGTGGTDGSAHLTPARVEGAPPFVALTAGSVHTCGRTSTGQLHCWGRNPYGQLGDGTTTDRWRPSRVAGGPYVAVSAAGAHTCAVTNGAPVCWGYNVSGQLGDGTRAHHAAPVRVARTGS